MDPEQVKSEYIVNLSILVLITKETKRGFSNLEEGN